MQQAHLRKIWHALDGSDTFPQDDVRGDVSLDDPMKYAPPIKITELHTHVVPAGFVMWMEEWLLTPSIRLYLLRFLCRVICRVE